MTAMSSGAAAVKVPGLGSTAVRQLDVKLFGFSEAVAVVTVTVPRDGRRRPSQAGRSAPWSCCAESRVWPTEATPKAAPAKTTAAAAADHPLIPLIPEAPS